MSRDTKERDRAFGIFAEDKAVEYYISQGYAIRERNWRFHHIEIDIIAQTWSLLKLRAEAVGIWRLLML